MAMKMTYEDWLQVGIDAGHISAPWCWVHDSPTLTDEEVELTDGGDDLDAICVFAVRLQPELELEDEPALNGEIPPPGLQLVLEI